MMRLPHPDSRSARWSRRLAVFALPVLALTTVLHRFGAIETPPAVVLLGIGILLALVALVLGLWGLVTIWRRGGSGARAASLGILLAAALLAWPAWQLSARATLPTISDVTTDWQNPPPLQAAARDRPPDAKPASHPGAAVSRAQAIAYPEIVPFFLGHPALDVYEAARRLVAQNGWRELAAEPPSAGQPGRIEAVARTLVFGFEDDVAIRIAPRGPQQTRIDMRSASRYGDHDLGANAARIFGFLGDLQTLMESPVPPPLPLEDEADEE